MVMDMILHGRAGPEGFILATWLSVIECIPEETRFQFINEIVDKYMERRPLEDGMAKVGMSVLTVAARRPG
jgi:hypothetical protein